MVAPIIVPPKPIIAPIAPKIIVPKIMVLSSSPTVIPSPTTSNNLPAKN
jgi:hypothetical protein